MRGGVPIGADRDPRDVLIPQTRAKSWPVFGRSPASVPIYTGHIGGAVILSVCSPEGDDTIQVAFVVENYRRLVEFKNKYDPTNFFILNKNIKPRYLRISHERFNRR